MLALLILAVALGLSNFAAAVGIGVSGVHGRAKVQIAVVFGLFEAGMPVLGVALGQGVAASLGQAARWLGGAALIAIGVTSLIGARRSIRSSRDVRGVRDVPVVRGMRDVRGVRDVPVVRGVRDVRDVRGVRGQSGDDGPGTGEPSWPLGRVTATGLALSVDNLAAGFALGAYHTGLAVAAVVFGAVSVIMSLAGLELGARLGAGVGDRSELVACALLIGVGAAVAAGVF